jgi:hypothetical protein
MAVAVADRRISFEVFSHDIAKMLAPARVITAGLRLAVPASRAAE